VVSIDEGNAVKVFSGAAVLGYPTRMNEGRRAEKQKRRGAEEENEQRGTGAGQNGSLGERQQTTLPPYNF
jgi:hypothetical protein